MDNPKRYYIWGRKSCPYCIRACEVLYENNKLYDFFDHDGDEKVIDRLKDFYQHYTVPIIVENDTVSGLTKFVGGFDDLEKLMKDTDND